MKWLHKYVFVLAPSLFRKRALTIVVDLAGLGPPSLEPIINLHVRLFVKKSFDAAAGIRIRLSLSCNCDNGRSAQEHGERTSKFRV